MKKILCFVLALLMAVFLFASCDNTETPSTVGTASDSATSTESEAELFSSLRDWDGDDAVFMFLVGGMQWGERYHSREIGAEEYNNELINDAVFDRNALVESKFHIDIQAYATSSSENIDTIITNEIGSNLYTYDVVMPIMDHMVFAAADGYFFDLYDSDIAADLDLSKEWWDQKAVADLSIGNSLYFTTGYMSILDNECTQAFIFNKSLVKENELESPYALVKEGKWTYDKMMELAANVTADDDGIDGMTSADTYGAWFNTFSGTTLFIGSGHRLISKKEDTDLPYISITDGNAADVVAKIASIIGGNKDVQIIEMANISGTGASDVYYYATEAFANGRALFRQMALVDLYELSDYDCSYGILPIPKYDVEQEDYYCHISTIQCPGIAIPVTNPNPENAALVLAAMGEASADTLNTAYYDILLKNRKVEDTESGEMLDIIFENRVYDLGFIFAWGYINHALDLGNAISATGASNFASYWGSIQSRVQSAMDKTIESFELG